MGIVRLVKKNLRRLSILVNKQELKGVLALTLEDSPARAEYKIGDTIRFGASGRALSDLKVYGMREGGYGFAYIVLDEETLNPYCLKTIRNRYVNSTSLDEFKREAEVWIRLGSHPHIVSAHSVSNISGRPFLLL